MKFSKILLGAAIAAAPTFAFNANGPNNVVAYWGQNSVSYAGGTEASLAEYCNDSFDILVLAFVPIITNNVPIVNLAYHCTDVFPGTQIANCPQVGQDIKTCQAKGKKVILSIGGASGAYSVPDAASGTALANNVWNMFMGGSSSTRTFGDAQVDGVDLDLEGGNTGGFTTFINVLRQNFKGASKPYYITSAPQCPFPDAYVGPTLEAAWFDFIWVQFYNNYCGAQAFGTNNFNFAQWNTWATTSVNPNVKIFLGLPGSSSSAGTGYVSPQQVNTIVDSIAGSSNFGGVMFWDAGTATQSGMISVVAPHVHALSGGGNPTTTTTTTATKTTTTTTKTTTTTTSSPSPTGGTGTCSAAAWSASTAYNSGAVVSYNGHQYTAQWWSQNNIPTSGAPWTDNGACSGTGGGGSGSCAGVNAWSSSTAYNGGAKVTYGGFIYTAQWWTQGETPGSSSAWSKGASCTPALRRRRISRAKRFNRRK